MAAESSGKVAGVIPGADGGVPILPYHALDWAAVPGFPQPPTMEELVELGEAVGWLYRKLADRARPADEPIVVERKP